MRRLVPDDVDRQMGLLNSDAVMLHLGGPKQRDVIAQKHAKSRALFDSHGFGFMMLEHKDSGELLGHCGLKHVDHPLARNPGDMEVGWLIGEKHWRKGYAFEAVNGVIDFAFAHQASAHIVALTSLANVPSWRLMEKIGMQRREDLDFIDPDYPPEDNPTIVYAIKKDDWSAGPAPHRPT